MKRTLTIKGIGQVSIAPDLMNLYITLNSKDMDYQKAMEKANHQINEITDLLLSIYFNKEDIKTINFDVSQDYRSEVGENNLYHSVFDGYNITHELKISFDFNSNRLSQAIGMISKSSTHPDIRVEFTIKDKSIIQDELLKQATKNAKLKADILCESSQVRIKKLLSISYDFDNINTISPSNYRVSAMNIQAKAMDFEAEDIKVSDSVTFVWQIK